jgi:hypothetical protein
MGVALGGSGLAMPEHLADEIKTEVDPVCETAGAAS